HGQRETIDLSNLSDVAQSSENKTLRHQLLRFLSEWENRGLRAFRFQALRLRVDSWEQQQHHQSRSQCPIARPFRVNRFLCQKPFLESHRKNSDSARFGKAIRYVALLARCGRRRARLRR